MSCPHCLSTSVNKRKQHTFTGHRTFQGPTHELISILKIRCSTKFLIERPYSQLEAGHFLCSWWRWGSRRRCCRNHNHLLWVRSPQSPPNSVLTEPRTQAPDVSRPRQQILKFQTYQWFDPVRKRNAGRFISCIVICRLGIKSETRPSTILTRRLEH